MCGIFGSKKFSTFKKLYNLCQDRGSFSYGSIYSKRTDKGRLTVTIKEPGIFDITSQKYFSYENIKHVTSKFELFLGHTQAPTSSKREYHADTTHPFRCGNWIVAHNGVLTNHIELKQQIKDTTLYNAVDTSIIPVLIDTYYKTCEDEVSAISETLSLLQGTFSVWVHHMQTGNTYIGRSGSTLYANMSTCDFSSLPDKRLTKTELEEGILYTLTPEGITTVGVFASNSPFFLL